MMRSPIWRPAASATEFWLEAADHHRLSSKAGSLRALQQDERHDDDGQGQVHHRPHHQHLEPLPFRLREELVRRPGPRVFRSLARHLDVAAERNRADAVLGVAALERQQLRTEAEREREDADADPPGHQEMAELVDEN